MAKVKLGELNMDHDLGPKTPMIRRNFGEAERSMQYVASGIASIGAICAGSVLSWSSPALPQLMLPENTTTAGIENGTSSFYISKSEEAVIGSIVTIGALVAAVPTGYLADKFGRRLVNMSLGLSFVIGWILVLLANGAGLLAVARFFSGIGLGGVCVTVPMYISEIAENEIRGRLNTFFPISLSLGIFVTALIGSLTTYITLSIILLTVPAVWIIGFYFLPDTHVYYAKINEPEAAERTLTKFRGTGESYDIQSELKVIQLEISESHSKAVSLKSVIASVGNRRAIVAVVGCMSYMQLCGINVVVFYAVNIFKAAGTSLTPSVSSIIVAGMQVLGSYISVFVIEKAGRKFFLMVSTMGMFLALTGLAIFFHLKSLNIDVSSIGFVPLGSVVVYMISFSVGYGCVPLMLMHELFAPEIRGVASGVSVVANWLFAFIVTFSFPIMIDGLGNHNTFYICAAVTSTSLIFAWLFVPETRGKTLLQIQEALNK